MNVVKVSDELGGAVETYELDLRDRPIEVTNVESQKMTIKELLHNNVDSNSSLQCGSASAMKLDFRGTRP